MQDVGFTPDLEPDHTLDGFANCLWDLEERNQINDQWTVVSDHGMDVLHWEEDLIELLVIIFRAEIEVSLGF